MPYIIKICHKLWSVLISLKFAVLTMIGIAIALAAATIIESITDSQTAQYYVYRSIWFYALLATLGALILAVALSRLPWKKKHLPFLCAHAGILLTLYGSWLTAVQGVDGNLRITEGEIGNAVELDQHVLVVTDAASSGMPKAVNVPWVPSSAKFREVSVPEYGLKVTKMISDAAPELKFVPTTEVGKNSASAIQLKITGAPMMGAGSAPEFWLWSGETGWATQKLGLARFWLKKSGSNTEVPVEPGEARLELEVLKDRKIKFTAISVRGEKKIGVVDLEKEKHPIIDPSWKMPIKIQVRQAHFLAKNETQYAEVKTKAEMGAVNSPAILVESTGGNSVWLGLGDRVSLDRAGATPLDVGYFPRRIVLPFGLYLDRFEMKHYPGTETPASYESKIRLVEQVMQKPEQMEKVPQTTISMNEPFEHDGFTFYQASYIPDVPRALTTVLSVNKDPGRWFKYWGSLLIVFGAIWLYLRKSLEGRKKVKT